MKEKITKYLKRAVTGTCLLALALTPAAYSQVPQPVPAPVDTGQPIPVLSANQLQGLVAPLALYPDPLISQVLVASTYPLEVVEAYQWLQRNPGLTGPALTQAAATQNWDPSVQALVMFPDVLKRLNEDITWTTNLGNAFLNQQADVMSAIQQMRASAEQSGKLVSTPQQQVINTTDQGQPVVQIVPTNPEVIYVPTYDPAWVWGPPIYYPYARWYYPPYRSGLFFDVGIGVGAFFGAGWGGWGGWGWHPAWGSRSIVVNNVFINRYHFDGGRLANFPRQSAWAHDSFHRQGVPYPNQALSQRFAGNFRQNASLRQNMAASRATMPAQASVRGFAPSSRPAAAPTANMAPRQSFSRQTMTPSVPNRTFSAAPARNSPAFRAERSYAAPQARSYAPSARSYSAPARSYAPQARSYEPQARSMPQPSRSGGSASHGGSSHGSGGRAKR